MLLSQNSVHILYNCLYSFCYRHISLQFFITLIGSFVFSHVSCIIIFEMCSIKNIKAFLSSVTAPTLAESKLDKSGIISLRGT